ncbi:hypothetical protein BVRB_7g167360 [Beta vulgaris subsp. vulgaris]|nr:hypothetical protein BVRB_7g167360 [Beta vulgaris subsp. vulgaris]
MDPDASPSTSDRDPSFLPRQIDIGESSSMPSPSRPEPIPVRNDVLHSGIWLAPDYSHGPKTTVICKVPDDFPRRRHFTKPYPRMDDVPKYDLSAAEKKTVKYFGTVDMVVEGEETEIKAPRIWLPHAKYILGNGPLSAVFLCRTHPEGDVSLDLEELGLDDQLRPMSNIPDEPVFDHDTVNGLTGGPRGAGRNTGRGGRAGRTVRRAGHTSGRAPGRGEPTPSRSAIQVPINRGGSTTSRRRPRDPEAEVPNKRKYVEVNSADVTVVGDQGLPTSPARGPMPEVQLSPSSLLRSPGTAVGSSSSTRQKVYELLSRPSFLSDLGPGIYCRAQEWIETSIIFLCAAVKAALFHPPSTAGQLFRPNLDVREDESIFADIPANGGTLGYRLLKGLQLPFDRPADKLVAPAAQLAHDLVVAGNSAVELIAQYLEYQRLAESAGGTIQGLEADKVGLSAQISQLEASVESEKKAKAEVDKELGELRLKAKELEDLQLKNSNLEVALKASKDERETAVKNAAAEARQAAVADFKRFEEFVGLLGERYDGGWVAAKRCVCHSHPSFDWEQMEVAFGEGVHRQPLADEPYICSEEIIANILPTAEDDAPPS